MTHRSHEYLLHLDPKGAPRKMVLKIQVALFAHIPHSTQTDRTRPKLNAGYAVQGVSIFFTIAVWRKPKMVRTSTAAASSTNENKKIARATFWVTVRACESNSASSWSAFWNSSASHHGVMGDVVVRVSLHHAKKVIMLFTFVDDSFP